MSRELVDVIRGIDPALARIVARSQEVADELTRTVEENENTGDNNADGVRFYGSVVYKLGEEQTILCQLILSYCKFLLSKKTPGPDRARQKIIQGLAKWAKECNARTDDTLKRMSMFRDLWQREDL